jgi:DNA (cytosine-5)-methyltransferase 1
MQGLQYQHMVRLLSVHDASKIVGVSIDTIRRWDKKGLIKTQRSELNHRLFNLSELERVQNKVSGKHSGNNYKILRSSKKTPHRVVELFAGAGGTALGFHNAGLQHVLLTDWDKDSTLTLQENHPDWNIVHDDVRNIKFKGLSADIVEGGFPCQAFSSAGKKLGFEDTRGTMFFEFARCVKEIRPKIAMGENVRGLLNHDDGKTLGTIVNVLKGLGYRVAYKILRAQYLDVPQKRERLIILAVRNDLKLPIYFPREKDYTISMREALTGCPESEGQLYPKGKKSVLAKVPPGGYWRDLPINMQREYMGASFYQGGGKTGMARRLSWDEPSLTLTCAPAQKQTERCHPSETRPLNVREYARIQTFPDNWTFNGSIASQYKQIGNAVPVNLGYHIGKCLIAMLEKRPNGSSMEKVELGKEEEFNRISSGK